MGVKRFCLAVGFVAGAAFGANRILLVGDSITEGYFYTANYLGFRDDLFQLISGSGWPFDFTGSFGQPPYECHSQYGGYIRQFYPGWTGENNADVTDDMDRFRPNIVIVHLGTNDMGSWDPISPYSANTGMTFDSSRVSGRMGILLSKLSEWKTGYRGVNLEAIFVAKMIPKKGQNAKVEIFNREMENIAADAKEGRIPSIPPGTIRLVDQYTGFDEAAMMGPDGIHPNEAGYVRMADVFWRALRTMPMHIRSSKTQWDGPAGQRMGPLNTLVTDDYGVPVSGVPVRFTVSSGTAGVVEPESALTDVSGIARAWVRLGGEGVSTLRASADNLIDSGVDFTLTARPYFVLEGMIRYRGSGLAVSDVGVFRKGSTLSAFTGSDGRFRLLVPTDGQSVTLSLQKTRWSGTGTFPITLEDAWRVASQATGIAVGAPLTAVTADADGDNQITVRDAAFIARFAAGFIDSAAAKLGVWHFTPDSVQCGLPSGDRNDLNGEAVLCGDADGQ